MSQILVSLMRNLPPAVSEHSTQDTYPFPDPDDRCYIGKHGYSEGQRLWAELHSEIAFREVLHNQLQHLTSDNNDFDSDVVMQGALRLSELLDLDR